MEFKAEHPEFMGVGGGRLELVDGIEYGSIQIVGDRDPAIAKQTHRHPTRRREAFQERAPLPRRRMIASDASPWAVRK